RQLEDLVVQRLSGTLSAEQAATLRQHVQREENAKGRDGPESIRLAGEFHILLAEMTGNALLTRYIGEVVSRCCLILALYARPHSSDCAVNEHAQLIDALSCGDAAKARHLMDHHIGAVQERALIERRANGEQMLRTVLNSYAARLATEGSVS
ncbi:MAG: GntR family transcriptional regulator, partial [Beijerinckiaceae bacterium]